MCLDYQLFRACDEFYFIFGKKLTWIFAKFLRVESRIDAILKIFYNHTSAHPPTPSATIRIFSLAKYASSPPLWALLGWGIILAAYLKWFPTWFKVQKGYLELATCVMDAERRSWFLRENRREKVDFIKNYYCSLNYFLIPTI